MTGHLVAMGLGKGVSTQEDNGGLKSSHGSSREGRTYAQREVLPHQGQVRRTEGKSISPRISTALEGHVKVIVT